MPRKDTTIEKRAKLIIKYRKMRVRKKEKNEDIIKYSLLKDDKKYVMQCISNQRNVGIAYVRDPEKLVGTKLEIQVQESTNVNRARSGGRTGGDQESVLGHLCLKDNVARAAETRSKVK